ncbi:hypothetical protein ES705_30317 [subsurface metagenome]
MLIKLKSWLRKRIWSYKLNKLSKKLLRWQRMIQKIQKKEFEI